MDTGSLLMLAVVMAIFYFMLVRPQKKRLQEHNKLIKSLQPGDEVVTISGLYGFVNSLDEDMIWLEVSEGVEVRVTRQAVSKKIGPPAADEPDGDVQADEAGDAETDVVDEVKEQDSTT